MNIKSLLLGSAAALVAVSGARAADAIIAAEPEPVEYVRVCDAFGTGYFYIPGTETCLKLSGYLRTEIFGGDLFAVTAGNGAPTYDIDSRFALTVETASETELGTLKTLAEVRWTWATGAQTNGLTISSTTANTATASITSGYTTSPTLDVNHATISLGGLTIGKTDSFFTTWTKYGTGMVKDNLAGSEYGRFGTNLISYTFSGGAWDAGIALEQGTNNLAGGESILTIPAGGGNVTAAAATATSSGWGIDDYMPHVVAGLGITVGMVDIRGTIGWDSRNGTTVGGWAGKIRTKVQLNEAASAFLMVMYGQNTSAYTTWGNGTGNTLGVLGGLSYAFSEKATAKLAGGWAEGNGSPDDWNVGANVKYALVPGLDIIPEIEYESEAGAKAFGAGVRVQRTF